VDVDAEGAFDCVLTQVAGKGKGDRVLSIELVAVEQAGGLSGRIMGKLDETGQGG
jgi:hypothetical protein